jgi:hypothetical protein
MKREQVLQPPETRSPYCCEKDHGFTTGNFILTLVGNCMPYYSTEETNEINYSLKRKQTND